jgi:hypothetical protein
MHDTYSDFYYIHIWNSDIAWTGNITWIHASDNLLSDVISPRCICKVVTSFTWSIFCKWKRYLWPAYGEYVTFPQDDCKTWFVVNYELKKLVYFKSDVDVAEKNGGYKQGEYPLFHLYFYRSHSSTSTCVRLLSIRSMCPRKIHVSYVIIAVREHNTSNI